MPQTTQRAQWQLQTAKAQLSELIEAALRGEPQRITRRGKDAVVVVSEESFFALKQSARQDAAGLTAHLLAMPREKISRALNSPKVPRAGNKDAVKPGMLRLREIDL